MEFLILIAIIAGISLVQSLLLRKRVGIIMLSLVVGFIISKYWTEPIVEYLNKVHILSISYLDLFNLIAITLLLLPSLVILISSKKAKFGVFQVVASLIQTLLMITLVTELVGGNYLNLEGLNQTLHDSLHNYSKIIVTVCLVYAILDVSYLKIKDLKPKTKEN